MNAISISFCVVIVLLATLLLTWSRKLKPGISGFQTQRMCPFCGLITSRRKARCLECGVAIVAKP